MSEISYTVLWVDDVENDPEKAKQMKAGAQEYGLILDHYTNWEHAHKALHDHFEKYSAIILDAWCKISANEDIDEHFLNIAIGDMRELFGQKHEEIPWYILSAGTMEKFDFVIESAINSRKEKDEEWGSILYLKDNPDTPDNLFENISRIAPKQERNKILYLYDDMFQYIGSNKLISKEAHKYVMDMLLALHCPEKYIHYQYAGNPIRKVVEFLFRAARKLELLPSECFSKNEKDVFLTPCRRYMAGETLELKNIKYPHTVRYGEESKGDTIFSEHIANIVKDIITVTSKGGVIGSHTNNENDNDTYTIGEDVKELFFGYVLQLCHVIRWFGKFVESHSNLDENKKMIKREPIDDSKPADNHKKNNQKNIENTLQVQGNTMQIKGKGFESAKVPLEKVIGAEKKVYPEKNFLWAGDCILSKECVKEEQVKVSDNIQIVEVVENRDVDDIKRYPYIATKIVKIQTT